MYAVAWWNFRARPGRFAGSLIALTLGVALIAATGLVLHAQSVAHPPAALREAYTELGALMGVMAGISGFVCVFVVAGTAALSITQRRRELALLRLVGARPRQVRRMVLGEATLTGLLGAVVGNALALPVGYAIVAGLRRMDVGPPHLALRAAPGPMLAAGAAGIVVALAGVWVAARRTRKVRAVEALRAADVDARRMPFSRWLFAVLGLGGGIAMLFAAARATGDGRFSLLVFTGDVLIVGAAALAPVLVPALVALVAVPLRRRIGIEVAAANLRAQARRTAAVAAPMLVLLGIAGSTFTSVATLADDSQREFAAQLAAPYVLADASPRAVAALRAAPGVAAVAPVGYVTVHLGDAEYDARVIATPGDRRLFRYDTVSGTLGDGLVATTDVAAARGWRVGDRVTLTMPDGKRTAWPLVATVPPTLSGYPLMLPASSVGPWEYAAVALAPGTDPASVGVPLVARRDYLDARAGDAAANNRIGLIALFGMAAVYTAIAIVNTLVMSVRERTSELARMRLAGATARQAIGLLLAEGALVFTVAVGLAALVTGITAAALPASLRSIDVPARLVVPWPPLALAALGCAALVAVTTLLAGRAALRHRPLDALGITE